jgi:pyruvate formate lyase activating enzyme
VSTGVDGPGTRFVVFLQGCPLRCLYCPNPDTWRMREGSRTSADTIIEEAEKLLPFLRAAGGGATISGGEPLLQPHFTHVLLHGLRTLGLHTALDTSGFLGARADRALLDATDLVLLDIKCWDPALYRKLTGARLAPTLDFARRLARLGKPVHLRYVLVPGLTDPPAELEGVARFAAGLGNVERVDVLPFHKLGAGKYRTLGIPFPLAETPAPTGQQAAAAREVFTAAGLTTY